MSSSDYQWSDNTPYKQDSFEAAIRLNIELFKAIKASRPYFRYQPYCYIDLNAGPGQDGSGRDGSPLIFLKAAREHEIEHQAFLFERNPNHARALQSRVDLGRYSHAEVRCQDHHCLMDEPVASGNYQYGAIYADPSNAAPSWDVLKTLSQHTPRMDILINLACASYKRAIRLPDYVPLDKHLFDLKPHWLVREPIDTFQWSILCGTNWANYPELKKRRFHSINTERGKEILKRLIYTDRERGLDGHPGLL